MHASRLDRLLADLAVAAGGAVQRETDLTRANDRDPAAVVRDDAHVNVWGRTMPQRERSGDQARRERDRKAIHSAAAMVEASFAGGVPAALNGVSMPLTELIAGVWERWGQRTVWDACLMRRSCAMHRRGGAQAAQPRFDACCRARRRRTLFGDRHGRLRQPD